MSAVLNLASDDKYANKDYGEVAQDILTNSKYLGQNVPICWHHGEIPALAQALGVETPPSWVGTVFDRVWVIRWPGGAATLVDEPQQLLFGDSQA